MKKILVTLALFVTLLSGATGNAADYNTVPKFATTSGPPGNDGDVEFYRVVYKEVQVLSPIQMPDGSILWVWQDDWQLVDDVSFNLPEVLQPNPSGSATYEGDVEDAAQVPGGPEISVIKKFRLYLFVDPDRNWHYLDLGGTLLDPANNNPANNT